MVVFSLFLPGLSDMFRRSTPPAIPHRKVAPRYPSVSLVLLGHMSRNVKSPLVWQFQDPFLTTIREKWEKKKGLCSAEFVFLTFRGPFVSLGAEVLHKFGADLFQILFFYFPPSGRCLFGWSVDCYFEALSGQPVYRFQPQQDRRANMPPAKVPTSAPTKALTSVQTAFSKRFGVGQKLAIFR